MGHASRAIESSTWVVHEVDLPVHAVVHANGLPVRLGLTAGERTKPRSGRTFSPALGLTAEPDDEQIGKGDDYGKQF
jgi:hypothetical protein